MQNEDKRKRKTEGEEEKTGGSIMKFYKMTIQKTDEMRKDDGNEQKTRRRSPTGGNPDGGGVFSSFSLICRTAIFHLRQMCFAY